MYESGDTTVFNVDAFEMPRGTVLLNLVRRMPGLRYEDGQLTYRDSVIHEIRLNGESFFAHDMKYREYGFEAVPGVQDAGRHAEHGHDEALGGGYDYEKSGE